MDPNANLDEQLAIVKAVNAIFDRARTSDGMFTEQQRIDLARHAVRLAELVEALDHWITGGGFPPARWTDRDMETQVRRFVDKLR